MSSISRGSVARCLAILNLRISAATVSRWSLFSRLLPGIAVAAPAQSIRARRRRFPCVSSGALAAITLAPMLELRTRPQAIGVADGHLNLSRPSSITKVPTKAIHIVSRPPKLQDGAIYWHLTAMQCRIRKSCESTMERLRWRKW